MLQSALSMRLLEAYYLQGAWIVRLRALIFYGRQRLIH